MLKTSPTVKASWGRKHSRFSWFRNSPISAVRGSMLDTAQVPSGLSAGPSRKERSFFKLMTASSRKPETPLSSHQFTISQISRRTSGFSQFRSGCSLAKVWK